MVDRRLLDRMIETMAGNPQQLQAVQAKTHCVVLAGPGSGKTRTLTAAMARTLLEDVVEPRGIACITYNNECAIELESRLAELGIEPSDRVFIGTVHSFALSQVVLPYAQCVMPDFPATLQIATKEQRDSAVITAYDVVFNDGRNPLWAWRSAEQKRKRDINRQHANWMGRNPELARMIEAYENDLRAHGLIDFDDMSLLAIRMVKEHEWIRQSLKAKFPVLFVDEYQDLGTALHELVLELCFGAGIRLFAVGDPDQSIYRFAGADPKLLLSLSERNDVATITLPFNYRCGTSIIDVANAALGAERAYRAPDGAHQGNILFDPVDGDLEAQANHVMQNLVPALRQSGVPLEEMAILYRDADAGNIVAAAAEIAGVPFVRADKNALVPRNNRLSRLIEAAASWVTGGWKHADPPFRRLTSEAVTFVFGGGATHGEHQAIERGLAAFLHGTLAFTGSTHDWLMSFRDDLITQWRLQARTVTDDWDVIDRMLAKTDPAQGNQDISLPHFSGRFEQSGRLNLSTLHSSKGREFDVVILFGMNKYAFPSQRDEQTQDALAETRRLFYVGVTRARRELRLVFRRRHYSPWVIELYRRVQRNNSPPAA